MIEFQDWPLKSPTPDMLLCFESLYQDASNVQQYLRNTNYVKMRIC